MPKTMNKHHQKAATTMTHNTTAPNTALTTAVPALRFPEFRGEKGWAEKKLGKTGKFTGGGTPSKANEAYWQGEYPWISSSDISEDSIYQIDIRRYITQEAIEKSATKKVPKNSILILSRVGIGKIAISYDEIYTSQDFTNLTPSKDDLLFLAYQLKSKAHKFSDFSQGMGIQGFTKDDISNFQVSLPGLQEQQKIADCLASIDAQITAESDYLQALHSHKQGLLQQLFPADGDTVPQLRFNGFDGDWEKCKFQDFVEIVDGDRGKNYPKSDDFSPSGYCVFLNAKNVTKYGFNFEKVAFIDKDKDLELSKGKLKRHDVVLTTRGTIGQFAYYSDSIPFENIRINSGMVLLRVKKNKLNSYYFYYFCQAQEVKIYIKEISFGNAQQQLTVKGIKSIPLHYPRAEEQNSLSLYEQQKIADCLSSLDDLITAQTDKIDALKQHKQGLMQQLFPRME